MSSDERIITYSPAYTLVPTYECFNRCSYCNFRQEPGKDAWLSLEEAHRRLGLFKPLSSATRKELSTHSLIEILILSGEIHPQSQRRNNWFQRLYALGEMALEQGFLPHTNAGPLSRAEMSGLAQVNVSLGLMLEQLTPALLKTVHRQAPSKEPRLRLQQLQWAGELGIPFTTGLLLGIGENAQDRRESLEAITQLHKLYGHIQEVILQPHSPGQQQLFAGEACNADGFLQTVIQAREILPVDITIQIPPNLARSADLLKACLDAGARDLGGLVPHDEVNPDYKHLALGQLKELLAQWDYELRPRLPVYPQYVERLNPRLRDRCLAIQAEL